MTITVIHFIAPLFLNFVGALMIIIKLAQNRADLQQRLSFSRHLPTEINRNHHILIAPCSFILFASPRLVISFMKGCMRSPREPLLYLIGYYAAVISAISTSIFFILPSNDYKTELVHGLMHFIRRLCVIQ